MNGLDDLPLIQKLYQASQAGVQIDLIVRGHSRLRPGLPGYSDNIRLRSIIGRFLEHDRIFYFGNGSRAFEIQRGQAKKEPDADNHPDIFIGSADWKRRNLSSRIEAITPVLAPELQTRIMDILALALADNRLAWQLHADGHYEQQYPANGDASIALHDVLMQQALEKYQ
jgi:polyphosphate kinase